jgi:sec-independent protein translocase protein TatA
MFGLGTGELIVIGVLLIVLFGAKKLPQLGDGLGKALRGFQRAVHGSDDKEVKPPLEQPEPGVHPVDPK